MHSTLLSLLMLAASGQASCAGTRKFSLKTSYDASNFFDGFNFRDVSFASLEGESKLTK
jgi:hypothetical protein